MKTTRRALVLLLTVAIVASLCAFPVSAANESATLKLTPIEAMPGEQFTTTLYVTDGSEIADFDVELLYDTSVVQLISAKASKECDGAVAVNTETPGVINLNYSNVENTYEEMPVLDIVFKVDDNAGQGSYAFLTRAADDQNVATRLDGSNYLDVPIVCDFAPLNIYTAGDIDLNGKVEIRDVTHLRRYLARLETLTDYQLVMADAYYDNAVNVRDAVYIQQLLAKFDVPIGNRANVYFYAADGALYATKSVVRGEALNKIPLVPNRTGYSKGAWSASATEYVEPDFSEISKDMKLYAFYSDTPIIGEGEFKIEYHLYSNDAYLQKIGVANPNPETYSSEQGMTLKNPVVAGYQFVGWFDGEGENATQIKSVAKGTTGDLELYAHWKAIEYTINYEVGMGNIKSEDKFKVNENKTLTVPTTDLVPMMANYIFLGWSDENGNLVKTIPAGTVPDNGANSLTFKANWTSRRNMAHPVSKLGDPMIFEDTDNGQILFTYELGTLENVPLYDVQTFDAVYGMKQIVTKTVTNQITNDQSKIISKKVSDAVTDSTEMTLGLGFTEQTSAFESSAIEHGKSREEANSESRTDKNTITVNNTQGGSNSTTNSSGYSATLSGTQSHMDTSSSVREKSYEYGTASDYTANVKTYLDDTTTVKAGAEAGASYGVGPAKASAKVYAEASNTTSAGISTDNTLNIKNYNNGSSYQQDTSSNANGWTSGTSISNSGSTTHSSMATWNTSKGYENSHEVATSTETRQAITELVSKQTSYGKDYIQNKSEQNKQGFAETQTTEDCNTSQVTYGEKMIETTGKTYEISGAAVGRYRVCCAGTAHVFAVVGYDVADSTYYTYSMVIMDDETHDFIDYSYDGTFTDYDNGVLPFEVPYFVNEYVSNRMAKTDGLIVDTDTGVVTGFDNDKQATFVKIPAYVSADNMDGSNRSVQITGISPTAFHERTDLEAIVLNDFITEIPDGAFEGCTNLKKILMPGVTKIGNNAFKGCSNFVQFNASTGVTFIGTNAFESVQNVNVKAANAAVADAVVNSGAKNITLNISAIAEEMAEAKITVPSTVDNFVLQGGGKTFQNMKLKSDAKSTTINQVIFADCSGIPLEISSSDVKLQNVTVNSTGYGILFTAEKTNISLYNNSYITSSVNRAIICQNLDVQKSHEAVQNGAASQLKVSGDILICGSHTGDSNVSFSEGAFKPIDKDTYDKYTKGMYQVTFDANGGALSDDSESRSVCYGETFGTLPEATREHYDFDGWFTKAEGGEQITESSVFSSAEDITLFAHWSRIALTLTFDANGGNVSNDSMTVYHGEIVGTLPVPTRDGCTFEGWFTEDGTKIVETTESNFDDDTVLRAHWKSDWILASNLPSDGTVTNTKWTYDLTTRTTSNSSTPPAGYSQYKDPTWVWGAYGSWSGWSRTQYSSSDSRKVESRPVTDSNAYTSYKYWIYRTADGWGYGTQNYYTGSSHGYCTKYDEINLTYSLPVYDSSLGLYGPYNSSMFSHSGDSYWFSGGSTYHAAVTHTEWRYADRSKVWTYYYQMVEAKESAVEVTPSDTVSNVQQWVQYVVE